MKNFKLSTIINEAFKIVVIFLFCYIWSLKIIKQQNWAIIASIVASIAIYLLIYYLLRIKNQKSKLKNSEISKINDITNTFIFSSETDTINFFLNLAKKKYNATKKGKYVLVEHADGNVALYPFFTYRKFNSDDLIYVYNKITKSNLKRIVICANNIDDSAIKLAEKLPEKIFLLNSNETYIKLLKTYDCYPEIKLNFKNVNKTSYKDLLQISLNKKRTKGYFGASICVLISSFFVRYNIYYIIISSLLLILSFISFVNPKYNKVPEMDLL